MSTSSRCAAVLSVCCAAGLLTNSGKESEVNTAAKEAAVNKLQVCYCAACVLRTFPVARQPLRRCVSVSCSHVVSV